MDKKGRQLRQQTTKKKYRIVGTSTNIRWIKNLGRASLFLKSYIRAALFGGTNTNVVHHSSMYYTYIHTKVLLLSCYTMAKNEKHLSCDSQTEFDYVIDLIHL